MKNDGVSQSIYTIGLGADKISPVGTESKIIPDAKWPVFFAVSDLANRIPRSEETYLFEIMNAGLHPFFQICKGLDVFYTQSHPNG